MARNCHAWTQYGGRRHGIRRSLADAEPTGMLESAVTPADLPCWWSRSSHLQVRRRNRSRGYWHDVQPIVPCSSCTILLRCPDMPREDALQSRLARIPIFKPLRFRLGVIGEGIATLTAPYDPAHDGIFNSFHGGLPMTLVDTAAGVVVLTLAGADAGVLRRT